TLISVNATGTGGGNGSSFGPSINAAGTEVAFASSATDLTADPITNPGSTNVFVRILGAASATTLVSVNASGAASGDGSSSAGTAPRLSADGRYVAFLSLANDLVPGYVSGNGGLSDLYLRDLQEGLTRLVTVDQSGTAGG